MGNLSEIYALIDSGNENDVQLGLIVWSGIDKAAHDTFVSEWQAWADLFGMSLCWYLANHGRLVINCSEMGLGKIPSVPNTVQRLFCSDNLIEELPPMPQNLKSLHCALADGFLMAKNILKTSLNNNKMIVIKLYNHFVYLIEKSLFKDGYKIDESKSTNIYDFFSNEFSDIWLNKPISENTPLTICPETNDFGRLLNLNKCLKDRPINISKGNDLVYVFVQNAFSVFVVAMSDINDSGISVWRVKENQKGEIDFDISRGNEWLIKHLLKDRIGIL